MSDLFTYAGMIKNEKDSGRIYNIVTDIVETDLISAATIKANNEHIVTLRELGETLLAESLLYNHPHKFK